MNELIAFLFALAATTLLLRVRKFVFHGQPCSHKQVAILSFENTGGDGTKDDEWPSLIEAKTDLSNNILCFCDIQAEVLTKMKL